MNFFQSLLASGDGYLYALWAGDSYVAGRNNSTGYGPTPPTGTAEQFDGADWIAIGATDVITATTDNGSPIPQFCIDMNAYTGKIIRVFPQGVSSSMYHTFAGYTTWDPAGTNYTTMETNVAAGLPAGRKLDVICVCLGENDWRVTSTIADVLTAMDTFYTALMSDFPGVPILIYQLGRQEIAGAGAFNNSRKYAINARHNFLATSNANIHIVGNNGALVSASKYSADNIHPNQTGMNQIGTWTANWFKLSGWSKIPRSYFSTLTTQLNANQKTLMADFLAGEVTAGNYTKYECFGWFMQPDINNCWVDLSNFGNYANSGATLNTNASLETDGSTNHFTPTVMSGVNNGRAGQNDFINLLFLQANNTAGTGIAMGVQNATLAQRLAQQPSALSVLRYLNNDLTASDYGGESVFANDSIYALARNAGTKYLLKEDATLASAAQASTGVISDAFMLIGAYNNAGTPGSRMALEVVAHLYAKYDGFDLTGFCSRIRYMRDHWND